MPANKYMRTILVHGKSMHYRSKMPGSRSVHYYRCIDLITSETLTLRMNENTKIKEYIDEEVENKDIVIGLKCCRHGKRFIRWDEFEVTFGYVGKVSKVVRKQLEDEHPELFI